MEKTELKEVSILFSGDSGDGMQLTGNQFGYTSAIFGNDINTFPDFPAEIRAPLGTIAGVSGYQVHFASMEINSPGDYCDVLVAMNAAALKKNLDKIKPFGIIIVNTSGFDSKNLRLAHYDQNPLDELRDKYSIYEIDITQQTMEILKNTSLSLKDKNRAKNMFSLGFIYWLFSKDIQYTTDFIEQQFSHKPEIKNANLEVLKAGYQYGEIAEIFTERFNVAKAEMKPGLYRNISGNEALVLGLLAAAEKSGLEIFYAGYPITPASEILQYLSKYKPYGVKTFQAEDEIAAMTSVIGAAFAGNLAITATSGPGMSLKTEAIGLGFILELPMIIINVQRGGPSTGLPTKTEQSDLLQAMHGRHGEAPLPIIAAQSPSDCFYAAYQAAKIALEHSTPVILLSDGYTANGTEPWLIPDFSELPNIQPLFIKENNEDEYLPYKRNQNFSRNIAVPGTKGKEHVLGGLEKKEDTGTVSYSGHNHEKMVNLRAQKVDKIRENYPQLTLDQGVLGAKILVLSWGSTYGSIKDALKPLIDQNFSVAHLHLRNLNPLPKDLESILKQFDKIVIPEINKGQLIKLIQDQYQITCIPFHKIQGSLFLTSEIKTFLENI